MLEAFFYTILEFARISISFALVFLPLVVLFSKIKKKVGKKTENKFLKFVLSWALAFFIFLILFYAYGLISNIGENDYGVFENYGLGLLDYATFGIIKILYWVVFSIIIGILAFPFYLFYLYLAEKIDRKIENEIIRDAIAYLICVASFIFISILLPWIFIGLEGMLWIALN